MSLTVRLTEKCPGSMAFFSLVSADGVVVATPGPAGSLMKTAFSSDLRSGQGRRSIPGWRSVAVQLTVDRQITGGRSLGGRPRPGRRLLRVERVADGAQHDVHRHCAGIAMTAAALAEPGRSAPPRDHLTGALGS